ncbi:MAG: fibronectin type III domain-containing protein [Bacteroidales bacterium]|nr:fibronectin type III domain-containing protein [Bacteroidales bacterium]
MRKHLLRMLLLAALLVPWVANAQIDVYETGSQQSYNAPIYPYSYMQSGSVMLYPASYLTEAVGYDITSLTFYTYDPTVNDSLAGNYSVWMSTTTSNSFSSSGCDAFDYSSYDSVWEGHINIVNGEWTINLNTAFSYTGGNLVVVVMTDEAGAGYYYYSPYTYWRAENTYNSSTYTYQTYYSYTSGSCRYYYTTSYSPSITIMHSGVTCGKPKALTLGSYTHNTASFSWDAPSGGAPTGYQYLCIPDTATPDWTLAQTTTSTSATVTGLTPDADYVFYLRADCGTSQSFPKTITVHTDCDYQQAPLSQDFESGTAGGPEGNYSTIGSHGEAGCWKLLSDYDGQSSHYNSAYPFVVNGAGNAHGGTKSVKFGRYYSGSYYPIAENQVLVAPRFSGSDHPINTLYVNFFAKANAAAVSSETMIIVGVMSDAHDASTFTAYDTIKNVLTTYREFNAYLDKVPSTVDGNIAIRVLVPTNKDNAYVFIDDVTIAPIPLCVAPINAWFTAVGSSTMTINWTPYSEGSTTTVRYREVGDSLDSDWVVLDPTTATSQVLTGLDPSTAYEVQLQATCESGTSTWSASYTYTTNCLPITLTGRSATNLDPVKYTMDFDSEAGGTAPIFGSFVQCWHRFNYDMGHDYGEPYVSTARKRSGSKSLHMYWDANNENGQNYAALPEVTNDVNTLEMRLYAYTYDYYMNNYILVGVMDDYNDPTTFTAVDTIPASGGQNFNRYVVSFANYTGTGKYIAFMAPLCDYNSYYYDAFIDDIELYAVSTCSKPERLIVPEVSAHSGTFSWNSVPGATGYRVRLYDAAAFDRDNLEANAIITAAATDTSLTIDATVLDITGLQPVSDTGLASSHTYYVTVAAICADGAQSDWTDPVQFNTAYNCGEASEYHTSIAGNENSTSMAYTSPFYAYDYDYYSCSGWSLFTAAEVAPTTEFGPGKITSISYYYDPSNGVDYNPYLRVYMVQTDLTQLTTSIGSFPVRNMTLVYSGRYFCGAEGGWSKIELQNAFRYNPYDSNLMVYIEVDSMTNTYDNRYFRTSSTTGTMACYEGYQVYTTNRAIAQFGFCVDVPDCYRVASAEVTDVAYNTATVEFEVDERAGDEVTGFTLYYAPAGTPFNDSTMQTDDMLAVSVQPGQTSITAINLQGNTLYDAWLVGNCLVGTHEAMSYTYKLQFRTMCNPKDIPYAFYFDSIGEEIKGASTTNDFNVICWDRFSNLGTRQPSVLTNSPYSGNYSLRMQNSTTAGGYSYVFMPQLATEAGDLNTLMVTFFARTTDGNNQTLQIYALNGRDTTGAELAAEVVIAGTSYKQYIVPLTSFNGTVARRDLALSIVTGINGGVYIDNLTIEAAPSIFKPTDLAIDEERASSVNQYITWKDLLNGDTPATQYEIGITLGEEFNPSNLMRSDFMDNEGDTVLEFDIQNLEQVVTYSVAVRGTRDAGAHWSQWSLPVTFRTACDLYDLPWSENFNAYTRNIFNGGLGYGTPDSASLAFRYNLPCWEVTPQSASGSYTVISKSTDLPAVGRNHGNYLAMRSSNNTPEYVVMPVFAGENVEELAVTFDYMLSDTSNGNILILGYVNNIDSIDATFVAVDTLASVTSWTNVQYIYGDDTDTAMAGSRIAFKSVSRTSSARYALIDNVVVSAKPTCYRPTMFVADSNVTAYTIPVMWKNSTLGTSADSWRITLTSADTVITRDVNVDELTIVADTNYYTITNLPANTIFNINLQSVCGDTSDVTPVEGYSVRTLNDEALVKTIAMTYPVGKQIGQSVIDNENNEITIVAEYGLDLDSVSFAITASDGATMLLGSRAFKSTNFYNLTSGSILLSVRAEDIATGNNTYTLNVVYESCSYPRNIYFTDIERRSFTVNFTELDPTINTFQGFVSLGRMTNEALEEAQLETFTGTTHTFDSLMRDKLYYVYLRAVCSENGPWAEATVRTMPLPCSDSGYAIAVGEGTSNVGSFFNTGWGNTYSQTIYPASELAAGGLTAGFINGIGFKFGSSDPYDKKLRVLIGTTERTEFPYASNSNDRKALMVPYDELIPVYTSGDEALDPNSNDSLIINFDNPYYWDGNSNLVIAFVLGATSNNQYSSQWYVKGVSSTGEYRTIQFYGDGETLIDYDDIPGSFSNSQMPYYFTNLDFMRCYPASPCPDVDTLWIEKDLANPTRVTLHWHADGDYANTYKYFVFTGDTTGFDPSLGGYNEATGVTQILIDSLETMTLHHVFMQVVCNGEGHSEDGASGWKYLSFTTDSWCRKPDTVWTEPIATNAVAVHVAADPEQAPNYRYVLSTTFLNDSQLESAANAVSNVSDTVINLTGLEYNQAYYLYLRNECGGTLGTSPYVLTYFRTLYECPAPRDFKATELSATGARLSWSHGLFAEETAWTVTVNGTGYSKTYNVTDTTMVVSGLQAQTAYNVIITPVCSPNPQSLRASFSTNDGSECFEHGFGQYGSAYTPAVAMHYSDYPNSYCQIIYTPEQVGGVGYLGAIAFDWMRSTSLTYTNLQIYVTTTEETNVASSFASMDGYVTCFNGTYTFDELGWNTINFTTPFYYDGTKNLLIAVYATSETQSSSDYSNAFRYYNFEGNYDEAPVRYTYPYEGMADGDVSDGEYVGDYYSYETTSVPVITFCFVPSTDNCREVNHLSVTDIDVTNVTAFWYSGNEETSWQYVNIASGSDETPETAQIQTTDTNVITINGLTRDTEYKLYVRPACAGDSVRWSMVTYTTLPTCDMPVELRAYSDTTNTATFIVKAGERGSATEFEYQYWPVNFVYDDENWTVNVEPAGEPVSVIAESDSIVVTGIPGSSNYQWRVRSACGANDSSRWVMGNTFSVCGVTNVPYVEDFDSYNSTASECWIISNNGGSEWSWSPSFYGQLDFSFYRDDDGEVDENGDVQYAILPELNMPLTDLYLAFNSWDERSAGNRAMVIVGYTDAAGAFTAIDTLHNTSTNQGSANLYEYYLDELPATAERIAFKALINSQTTDNYTYGHIDNVSVTTIPECRKPDNFRIANNDYAHQATLAWENNYEATAWRLVNVLDTVNYDYIDITAADVTDSANIVTYVLTNLTSNKRYSYRLYTVCSANSISPAANATVTFTTKNETANFTNFTVIAPAGAQVSPATINRDAHTVILETRADVDRSQLVVGFTTDPAVSSGTKVTSAFGDVFTSGDSLDLSATRVLYLAGPAADAIPVQWNISAYTESCPTIFDLTVDSVGRTGALLSWKVVSTQTDFVVTVTDAAGVATTTNITVEGEGMNRSYFVDGLIRENLYTITVGSNCDNARTSSVEIYTPGMYDCTNNGGMVIVDTTGSLYSNMNIMGMTVSYEYGFGEGIIPASKINYSGVIKSLSFYVYQAGASSYTGKYDFYLGTADMETMSGFLPASTFTKVGSYEGTLTRTGWYTIEFDTPYPYNGLSNLVIGWANRSGMWQNAPYFLTYNGKTNCGHGRYADGNSSLANVPDGGSQYTSNIMPVLAFEVCEPLTPCGEVENLTATLTGEGTSTATISWTEGVRDYFNGYEAIVSREAITDFTDITPDYNGEATSFSVDTLAAYTDYIVYVRTKCYLDEDHDDGYGEWASVTFKTNSLCHQPRDLEVAIAGKNTATVSWTGSATQAANYSIALTTAETESPNMTVTGYAADSIVFDTLQAGQTYYFYLQNICSNELGNSPVETLVFTMPDACTTPVNLEIAAISSTAAELVWESGLYGDETEWTVSYARVEQYDTTYIIDSSDFDTVGFETTPVIPDVLTSVNVSSRSYTLVFDQAEATYYVAVSSSCGTLASGSIDTFVVAPAYSACATIGDGTATAYAMTNPGWGNSFSEQIYTVEELNEMGIYAGYIHSFTINLSSDYTAYEKNVTILMGSTDKEAFDNNQDFIAVSDLEQVYYTDDPLIPEAGPLTFEFDDSYFWDGTSNLVVGFVVRATTNNSSTCYWYPLSHQTDSRMCVLNYRDGAYAFDNVSNLPDASANFYNFSTFYRANITFCVESSDCNMITHVAASDITQTSATVKWFPGNIGDTAYRYAYSTSPITSFSAANTTLTNELSVDLSNLEVDADYYFYVAPVCAGFTPTSYFCYVFATTPSCYQPDSALMYQDGNNFVFRVVPNEQSVSNNYELQFTTAAGASTNYFIEDNDTIVITDLLPFTQYSWKARTVCSDEEESRWTAGDDFYTCVAAEVPFAENFNGTSKYMNCWLSASVCSNPQSSNWRLYKYDYMSLDSTYMVYAYPYYVTDTIVLISPRINIPEANAYELSYMLWKGYSSVTRGANAIGMKVYVNSEPTIEGATLLGTSYNNFTAAEENDLIVKNGYHWGLETFKLPEAGEQYVIFYITGLSYAEYYMDNLAIGTTPTITINTAVNDTLLGTVTGGGQFLRGDTVTLVAHANDPHYLFNRWTRSDRTGTAGNKDTLTFVAKQNVTYTANFRRLTYAVNAVAEPAVGGNVTGTGTIGYGLTAELTAVPTTRYHFVRWSDGDTSNPRLYTVTGDTTFTAYFEAEKLLVTATSNTNDPDAVTGAGYYDDNAEVTLTANEVYGFTFNRWSTGDTTSTITFVLTQDADIQAIYDTLDFTVTVSSANEELGTVTGSGTYKYLTEVTVVATPADGKYFGGWSDNTYEAEYTFVLTQDTTLVASFTNAQVYAVNAVCDPEQGFTQGSTIDTVGAQVALSATANYGYIFAGWEDGVETPTRVVTITNEDVTYTALFVPDTFTVTLVANDAVMGTVVTVPNADGRYAYKSEATLVAAANNGYNFVQWADDEYAPATRTVTVLGDTTYTAIFEAVNFNVTATGEHGTFTGTGYHQYNTTATITAVPDEGYHFVAWSTGDTNATIDTLVLSTIELTATFERNIYHLTATVNDATMGAITSVADTNVYYGEYVTVSAAANYGYTLSSWSNGQHDSAITVQVKSDTNLVANFAKRQFVITATWTPEALGNVTGAGTYNYLDTATLTATPVSGAIFAGWSDGETSPVRTVVVTEAMSFQAIFEAQKYAVHAYSADTNMGTVTIAGNIDSASANDVVVIIATPKEGYDFVSWSNGAQTATIQLTGISSDTTLVATFALKTYTVVLTSNAIDENITLVGAGTYNHGDQVTVVATPSYGYSFTNWTDNNADNAVVTTDSSYTFTITSNVSLRANILIRQFSITVATNDSTMGTATANPNRVNYRGTSTLTATPNDNYRFVRWSDGNTDQVYVLTVTKDTSLIAYFEQAFGTVTVTTADTNRGTVSVDEAVVSIGTTTTIHAVAKPHYHFVSWNDGNTEANRTITVTGDVTYEATFAPDVYHVTLAATPAAAAYLLEGAGDVTYSPSEITTLRANSDTNYRFVRWSNGSTSSELMLVVVSDTSFTAEYEYIGGHGEGIDDVEEGLNVDIYAAEGQIYVRGAEQRMVYVYDAVGRLVQSQKAAAEVVTLAVKSTGVYVVKVEGVKARRVAVVR